jgi:FAD binding domain/Berberine and berberine like
MPRQYSTSRLESTLLGIRPYDWSLSELRPKSVALKNTISHIIVRNTGHDWVGRSTGAGALSIWTHHLKQFEFLPNYTQGNYSGMAARVGSGLEAWELYQYMDQYNMTIVVPGGSTVGAYGGWMAGGGHSVLGSYYGLGADQALSIDVVTPDGRFVTADPDNNADLFWALRGGGPGKPRARKMEHLRLNEIATNEECLVGTFGVVTSAIVKAYPPLQVVASRVSFSTGTYVPAETFWQGVNMYYWYGKYIADSGGTAYSYVSSLGTGQFTFSGDFDLPGATAKEVYDFVQPFFDSLNDLGITVRNPVPSSSTSWGAGARRGQGDSPGGSKFASRLFPRKNWENDTLFDSTMLAIREVVASGYTFHGIIIQPSDDVVGYPGRGAINPAFREAVMHADIFDNGAMGGSAAAQKTAYTRFNNAMNILRAATPGGGSYINEADAQEPDWQQSFFGSNYDRLLEIKRSVDPWGLLWAPTTVGSEDWEVKTADGSPTQNGPLCRVAASS